jgi:ParB family chromosome partitioning protein
MATKQAFDASRSSVFNFDPADLVIIGLDTKDGPEHPLYDPRIKLPLDEAMVLNIMTYGVLETVIARKNGVYAEVIDGRRRVMHAREANKRLKKMGSDTLTVRTDMKRGDDGHVFGMSVSTNEQRLDDTPMAKAQKLQRMLDLGKTEEECAIAFGVTKVAVKQWLKLLDLSAYVRGKVDKAEISASAAAKFSDLSHDEQKEAVDKLIKETGGKATAKKAGTAGKKAKGNDNAYDAPGKRVLKRVIENAQTVKELDGILTEDEIKILRWVIGDLGAGSIKGLTKLMEEYEDAPDSEDGDDE